MEGLVDFTINLTADYRSACTGTFVREPSADVELSVRARFIDIDSARKFQAEVRELLENA